MLASRGLRLSLIGGIIFFASFVALFLLPDGGPAVGMLVGGMAVWVGFIWTLMSYYFPSPKPPTDL